MPAGDTGQAQRLSPPARSKPVGISANVSVFLCPDVAGRRRRGDPAVRVGRVVQALGPAQGHGGGQAAGEEAGGDRGRGRSRVTLQATLSLRFVHWAAEQVFSSFPWLSRSGSLPLRFLGLLRFVQLANESERSHNNNYMNVSSACKRSFPKTRETSVLLLFLLLLLLETCGTLTLPTQIISSCG